MARKISYIYHTMSIFILVSFCNAYIIVTFRVRVRVEVWRFGSGNALVLINAVALHRAQLVLGWVTAFG